MATTRVLITVKAYPLPSATYDELVCTAGLLESGQWIRIYPVPFQFLNYEKYDWVELELRARDRRQDFRPESFQPKYPDLADLQVVKKVGTEQGWLVRRQLCLRNAYTSMTKLIDDSKDPRNLSLATFKPTTISRLLVENDDREWKAEWLERLKQTDMFTTGRTDGPTARVPIDKVPFRFKYEFADDAGRISAMTIEDWEIGALFRNCLASSEGDEDEACAKVREKYEVEFLKKKDLAFFLGTTLSHHRARHTNPFTIVGVFYPPLPTAQQHLFD